TRARFRRRRFGHTGCVDQTRSILRRVGPQHVQDFGLRAEVEVPAARKAGPRASRGSSPALVLQLRANDLGDDQALATFWQNRQAATWATRLPSCRVITNGVVRP